MYNILITGASGQVGKATLKHFSNLDDFNAIPVSHQDLDISNLSDLENYVYKNNFHAIINCAAYTAVDKAETELDACWRVNAAGTRNLAKVCNRLGIPFIHFSTDYVYHNEIRKPLLESDNCTPKNEYGKSKLAGEQQALYHHPKTIILRTSWVYSAEGNNFLNTISSLCKTKPELNIVDDQIGAPTLADDLAITVHQILSQVLPNVNDNNNYGIFNCSNQGAISWYDFANYFIQKLGLPCKIHPVPSAEFPRPAARPSYSVLNLDKIQKTFHLKMRDWKTALNDCLSSKMSN